MGVKPPELLGTAETLVADQGYADSKLIKKGWDQYQVNRWSTYATG